MESENQTLSAAQPEDVAVALNTLSERLNQVEAESNALRQVFVSLIAVIGSGDEAFVTRREIARLLRIAQNMVADPPGNLNPQLPPLIAQIRRAYYGITEENRARLRVVPINPADTEG